MSPLPAALCAVGRSTSRGGTHAPHTRRVRTDEVGWRTQASSAQPDASIRTAAPPTCHWRSRSVLPLHVHPIVPIVTIPECQALGAPRPHERRSGTTRLRCSLHRPKSRSDDGPQRRARREGSTAHPQTQASAGGRLGAGRMHPHPHRAPRVFSPAPQAASDLSTGPACAP